MREQLELGYVFGGLSTFGQRPFLTEPTELDSWKPDVAVVGAPFDISTTNRPGARFGPRAIRTQAYEPGTYHLDLGIEIFDWLEVVDYGDAYCPHGQTETSHANIKERVGDIARRGIVPIVLGGDHSITWPSATAVADAYGRGSVGLIHFDAHADTSRAARFRAPISCRWACAVTGHPRKSSTGWVRRECAGSRCRTSGNAASAP